MTRMELLELLAHPVRLRIVHAMSGARVLTTAQLGVRMPDVSKATVYRQVGVLAEEGVLEVVGEQRIRGAVERSYRLRPERVAVGPEAAGELSAEEQRRVFTAAMATLLAEFNAYLDRGRADPAVGYRQHAIWLSEVEVAELIGEMRAAIAPRLGNEPTPDRKRYLLSPILFPVEDPAD
jgi:DNA-binding transcriptional ArsR family regulator